MALIVDLPDSNKNYSSTICDCIALHKERRRRKKFVFLVCGGDRKIFFFFLNSNTGTEMLKFHFLHILYMTGVIHSCNYIRTRIERTFSSHMTEVRMLTPNVTGENPMIFLPKFYFNNR